MRFESAAHDGVNTGVRLRTLAARAAARTVMAAAVVCLRLVRRFGPRRRPLPATGLTIHLTGSIHAANWARAHVAPLVGAGTRVSLSTSVPLPAIPGVSLTSPPGWLAATAGTVPARLLAFCWTALRARPDVVGGFHLLLNGVVATLIARATGARAVYFCVGGPTEVLGGGAFGENRLFSRMGAPSAIIERQLVEIVNACDLVITMGDGARRFLVERGVRARIEVIGGAVACRDPGAAAWSSDIVFVGRLSPVKRVDILLRAVGWAAKERPGITLTVVGEGPLRGELEALAQDLGIASQVRFAGHQEDVSAWLQSARVFALTSESEGLSLALLEALACGLPAVVPDVGDLGEVVQDGVNGVLVRDRSPEAFGRCFVRLLGDAAFMERASREARAAAEPYRMEHVTRRWTSVLAELGSTH